MTPLRIALAGLGTVGGSVFRFLKENAASIEMRAGRSVTVVAASARDMGKVREMDLSGIRLTQDAKELPDFPEVDAVCELIGGIDGVAYDLCQKTLKAGKSLVTANKAMLAVHGLELARVAEEKGVCLMFEAAVCGGIPIIKTMREALAGNKIISIRGILNGTCNYILTCMEKDKADFETVLAEAQRLGYAEADPSTDVDGYDAAHKATILAALAFGVRPDLEAVSVDGLRRITRTDLKVAADLGCRIKLLSVVQKTDHGLDQHVGPCLVPTSSPLAHVDYALNAVQIEGNVIGPLTLIGRGAGGEPTASAVIGDLVDLARGVTVKPWGEAIDSLRVIKPASPQNTFGRWYIRLQVTDKAGVLADVAAILRDAEISIKSIIQHDRDVDSSVPVVILTHKTNEEALRQAVSKISALKTVWEEPLCMRMESGVV